LSKDRQIVAILISADGLRKSITIPEAYPVIKATIKFPVPQLTETNENPDPVIRIRRYRRNDIIRDDERMLILEYLEDIPTPEDFGYSRTK